MDLANFYVEELKNSLDSKVTELKMTCYRISALASVYDKSDDAEMALKYLCFKAEGLAARISADKKVLEDINNPLSILEKLLRALKGLSNSLLGR